MSHVDLQVGQGEMVVLLGANGAGKTTTLSALAGILPPADGFTTFLGTPTSAPLHRRVRSGLALITEERCVFMGLTVRQNLRLGSGDPRDALRMFPELEEHLDRRVGLLSGGQQQMLAVGRALATRPRVLLADELSLGLAPLVVGRLLSALRAAADEGAAVLVVEQHVSLVLGLADRAYVMRRGQVIHEGSASALRESPGLLADLYLEKAS